MFFKKKKKRDKKTHEVLLADSLERTSVRRKKSVVSTRAHPNRPSRGRGSISRAQSSLHRRAQRPPGYVSRAPGANQGHGHGQCQTRQSQQYFDKRRIVNHQPYQYNEGNGHISQRPDLIRHVQGEGQQLQNLRLHEQNVHSQSSMTLDQLRSNRKHMFSRTTEEERNSVYYNDPMVKRPPDREHESEVNPQSQSSVYEYDDPNIPPFTRKKRSPKIGSTSQKFEAFYNDNSNSDPSTTSSESEMIYRPVLGPRGRSKQDVRQWLSWRVKVNGQLSSYVMRMLRNSHGHFPVNELPQSMTDDTLNSILNQAQNDDEPVTSLDRYSYMIYGVPRVRSQAVRKTPSRSRSTRSNKRDSYRMLRRKLSAKINRKTNNNDVYNGNNGLAGVMSHFPFPDLSSQEESLDFTDEYLWTDEAEEQETEEEILSEDLYRKPSVVKRNKMAVHQQLLAKTKPLCKNENDNVPYDVPDENVVRKSPKRGRHVHTRPNVVERQISNRRSTPQQMPGRRNESFLLSDRIGLQRPPPIPGGVPTLLAGIQNLPNQAHVPLRHVLPKKSEPQDQHQHSKWSKHRVLPNKTGMR